MENSEDVDQRKTLSSLISCQNEVAKNMINMIFQKNQNGSITSSIENTDNLSSLVNYLLECEEEIKLQILNFLKFILENNLNNVEIINHFSSSNNALFSHNLLKIFLSSDKAEIRSVIKDIFEILLNNSNINSQNYEYIFQDIVKYFRKSDLKVEVHIMDRYLEILKVLYGERLNPTKPKNYFYLSGNASIKVQTKYLEEDKLKLNNGFVISLWFQQENYPNKENNSSSDILVLKLNKNNIKLQFSLQNSKLYLKSPSLNTEPLYKFPDGWNNFTLIVKPAKILRDTELLDQTKTMKMADFSCDSEVVEMIFFQNFIGQVSTILFLNKSVSEESLKILKRFNYGIYSEKKLNQLYKIANPSYLINSNYPFKNIKYSQKETDSANIILESFRILYIPSRFRENDCTIYDATGKYHGSITNYNNLNGIHIYLSLQSNIQYIGGINNLLPIIELCYTQNCINEEIFINYFEIVYFILNYKKNNMTNFFRIVSIFVEKFPGNIFTERILSLLLNIGKSLFSLTHDCNLSIQYFDEILLNEKIFTKFSLNLQIILWKNLYQFYVSDISLIKTFMNMKKLLILLRYYDQKKYNSYCCSEHSSQFDLKPDQIVIMDPPLHDVIENLMNITQLVVDGTVEQNMENIKLLMNVLNLDFSPCIIKGVITILSNFFRNNKVKEEIKKTVLNELVSEEIIEIILFTYSISLIDIRVEFVKLFQLISLPIYKEIMSFYLDKIILFLKEAAMPSFIKIKAKALEIECPLRERSIGITKKTNSKKSFDLKKLNNTKSIMISPEKANEESNSEISTNMNSFKRNNISTMGIIYETKEALTIITERSELNDTPKTVESERKKKLSLQYEQKSFEQIQREKEEELKKNIAGVAVEKEISIESPINKTPLSKHRSNKDKSLPKRINENMNSLDFDKEDDKENNFEEPLIKLNYFENSNNKADAFKSRIHKKSISGFSSTRSRKGFQNIFSPDKIIAIDTDDINKLYKYGGEKHEKNISGAEEKEIFEKSVRDLAKHCIEFMFDDAVCEEMKKGEDDITNLEENKIKNSTNSNNITTVISKRSSNLLDNQNNSDSKLLAQPKSVRGLTKINFTGFNLNKNVQEETVKEETVKEEIVKEEAVKEEAEKKEEGKLDFIENYVMVDKPKEIKNEFYEDIQMESLEKYFNPIIYKPLVENFYKSLIDWLVNKSKKSSVFDETDTIINPYVLDIIIRICTISDSNFLLKCLEDIYILLLNTKDNSNSIFKNSLFYPFLIETTYKFFLISNESKQTNSSAISIYILGKKIHTDLIISSIGKDDKFKTDPINKFHFLLSWGIYFKNLYNSQKSNFEINDFIKSLIMELINSFKQKLKTYSPSLNFPFWENYAALSILIYEYMVFYNLDKNLKDGSMFAVWSEETIVVPAGILSGLNLQHDKTQENIEKTEKPKEVVLSINDIWSDYKIFEANYSVFSQIFNKKMFSDDKYSVSKFERIVQDTIFNKKQKDLFADNIKLLFYSFRPNDNIKYNNIFVKCISNSFAVIISVLQEEKEIKYWIEEYEKFLIFLIVATTNMNEKEELFYQKVHDITLDIICFGLSYLIDEYFCNTIKQAISKKYYYMVIKNIFTLLILIYDHILEVQSKKKKNLLKVLSKGGNYMNSCVYRMFNEFIVDPKTKEPLINKQKINEFKQSQFVEIPTILKGEDWKACLYGNPTLKTRMKNLFDFPSYENIIKERYEVIKYYRPIYNLNNSPEEVNREMEKLKKKIYESIEFKLSRYENDYMKVQNKKYNDFFEKKFLYKQLKKNLFQWKGYWSDKDLYYTNFDKLRLKLKNHYTSYYARPFLTSILDIEYYLPKFTKFDRKRLFLNNDKNLEYNIKLNVDEILEGAKQQEILKSNISKGQTKNNFIYEIYQYCNKKVWNTIQHVNNLSLDYHTPQYFNIFLTSKKDDENDCIFECCYVKLSHHIKGIFRISKEGIFFKPIKLQYSSNEIEKEEDYDKDRKTCYGSSLTFHEKENDRIVYKWHFNDIKLILKRRYYYKKKAIEVFTYTNKSYFFTFKSQQKRDNALKIIFQLIENKREIKIDTKEAKEKDDLIIGIENLLLPKKGSKTLTLSSKLEEWANWKISNFELLMYLNIFGNRSFSDINQYPVFPWIVANFKEDIINFEKDFRDLSLPMGMLEIDAKSIERKERYLEEFKESNFDITEKQRHYGTHYSNPLTVAHYLTRVFPLTQMHIELQGGGFDNPNRLFFSIESSFSCATSLQGDVRELIPEFYYLPEMFFNLNNLDLGKRVDMNQNFTQVENVEVPNWANKNPYLFVSMMKELLERDEVSYKINEWADLIFGSKQRGKDAENYGNVFEHFTYEDNVILDIEDRANYECLMRKAEFGLTPSQLMIKSIPPKIKKEAIKKAKQFTESKELKVFGTPGQKTKSKEKPLMLSMKVLDNERVMCLFNNNTYSIYKFTAADFRYNISIDTKSIGNETEFKQSLKDPYLYSETIDSPCIIFCNGKAIAQAGYFDGRITVLFNEATFTKNFTYLTDMNYPIVVLKIDKEEKYVFAGSTNGSIFIYKINEINWNLHKVLYDHSKQITSISISNTLNAFASSSTDGFVNIYTLPDAKILRSISKNNVPIEKVFLSAFPLPCLVILSNNILTTYGINGYMVLSEVEENDILSPKVFTDRNHIDYLIYGNQLGELKIRKFPQMKIVHKLSMSDLKKGLNNKALKCLDISEDKKYIYFWQVDDIDITLVKDPSITTEAATVNLINMGFGF